MSGYNLVQATMAQLRAEAATTFGQWYNMLLQCPIGVPFDRRCYPILDLRLIFYCLVPTVSLASNFVVYNRARAFHGQRLDLSCTY